ncbi:Dolichyl phosphate glucosyltransferase [Christiangramia flava JLT2011]|uniref:dolichyl-phosphate beta-glucosyltransferase n=2 Tax=Christiangramia TaxID=292691 RepID=A0A1L7I736_9FLAO|nr:Dolichyl phosphate glucosyltransferase [Christiangramia flava JLT2011]OSS38523.1 Dolichyl phosphate glucosyltransferase [Christiangramia flava JLT2011]
MPFTDKKLHSDLNAYKRKLSANTFEGNKLSENMKILAIDDQQLVLMPLAKRLKDIGYNVFTSSNPEEALLLYATFKPDLLIVDINMPKTSGIEVIKQIKSNYNEPKPIMVLSGNTDKNLIVQAFELGVRDFMKKPLSLDEVSARVKSLIGLPEQPQKLVEEREVILQHRCVGVVIPCYNEEKRLKSAEFLKFLHQNTGYHVCFVNDGSTDGTLEVLQNLRKGRENYISIYNCEQNGGKAEAVRQGLTYMASFEDLDYVGFLDADLSTDFADFDDLVKTIETSGFQIVNGSRISRMGANISKESARKLISKVINFLISSILGMSFRDTQCGAKIMRKELVPIAFQQKFLTKWLFDVEIFMRMRQHFGKEEAQKIICEQPLKRWVHEDGSKLSYSDSLKIGFQLIKIYWNYRLKPFFTQTSFSKSFSWARVMEVRDEVPLN